MRNFLKVICMLIAIVFLGTSFAMAAEKNPLKPRVPADQRRAAKKNKNPIAFTKENVAKGKTLYEGKGTCFNCHGKGGTGDGPAGKVLNPSPRDFTNCKFHKKRKDGELMWVIKNGSPGTGLVPLIPSAITEEEAWFIISYERTFCKKFAKKVK